MCSGSDIFGSDICTCRPYLIFGILEAIKCAQRGGVGVVVYFTKEGRALGEVTKYLVYNARKRGGDNAAQYFERTELIAGVQGSSPYFSLFFFLFSLILEANVFLFDMQI